MASATSQKYIELAKALHPRLQRFFAKYPPTQILPKQTRANTAAAAGEWSPSETARAPITVEGKTATTATISPDNPTANPTPTNPFLPFKHPVTGKWQDPVYSLRRQAELVKLAREAGVEELLPFTNKGTEERIRHRVRWGLRVRGTGEGQKVKGHLYERLLAKKYVDDDTHTHTHIYISFTPCIYLSIYITLG